MKLGVLFISFFLLLASAFASDLDLGIKLYRDGMYELSAKAFEKALESAQPTELKGNLPLIASVFVRTGKFKDLEKLEVLWSSRFSGFKPGFLAGIRAILQIHKGSPIQDAINKPLLLKLTLDDRVDFFKAISMYHLKNGEKLYLLKLCDEDTEFKGAIVESGFVEKIAAEAARAKYYALLDYLFDSYGKWLSGKEFKLEYVKFLERKGRNSEALVELEKLFKKDQRDKVRYELARAYYLNGNYEKAIEVSSPLNTKEAKYLRAWSYYKLKDFDAIVKELSIDVSKPEEPKSLRVLVEFLSGNFTPGEIKEFYPNYYVRSLLFSFRDKELPSDFSSSEEIFYTGYLFYERGEFKLAVSHLKRAMGNMKDPSLIPAALYLIGKLEGRNINISSMVYGEIMTKYSNTPYYRESIIPIAETQFLQGNFPATVSISKYAREQLGINNDALNKLEGLSYFYMGDYNKAVRTLLRIKEKDFEVLNALSYAFFKLGHKEKSVSVLRSIVKRKLPFSDVAFGRLIFASREAGKRGFLKGVSCPDKSLLKAMWAVCSGDVDKMRGISKEVKGTERVGLLYVIAKLAKSPKEAIEAYSSIEALTQRKDIEVFAHNMKMYLAFSSKTIEPLIVSDPEFIAYNPLNDISDVHSLIEKAQDYEDSGQYLKAYGLYRLSLNRLTDNNIKLRIILKMVNIDLRLMNFKKALSDANLIQREDQRSKDIYNFCLFRIYNYMGKTIKSYEFAKKVSDLNNVPKEYRVNFAGKLASYFKLSGKKEETLKLIKFLLENDLEKVDYDDLVRLSIFSEKEGNIDEALKLINVAMKKARTKEQKVESLFWFSSYNEKAGNEDKALIGYLRIYYEYSGVEPWASTSMYRAAEILERKGDLKQALKLYEKVVKLKGNTDQGLKAKEKVQDLQRKIGGR